MSQTNSASYEFVRLSDIPQLIDDCARLHALVSEDDSHEGFEMRQAAFRKLALAGESGEDALLAINAEGDLAGQIAGFCVLLEKELEAFDDLGPWLSSLTYHPEGDQSELRAALTKEAEALARNTGASELYLHTPDKAAFEALGFAEIEPFERGDETIWVMGKLL